MEAFRQFWFGMKVPERVAFATRCGTTRGVLTQVAYGHKRIDLGLADVLVAQSGSQFKHEDLPLTERAEWQRTARGVSGAEVAPMQPKAA